MVEKWINIKKLQNMNFAIVVLKQKKYNYIMPIIFEINQKPISQIEVSNEYIQNLIDTQDIDTLTLSSPCYRNNTTCINTCDYKWFIVITRNKSPSS